MKSNGYFSVFISLDICHLLQVFKPFCFKYSSPTTFITMHFPDILNALKISQPVSEGLFLSSSLKCWWSPGLCPHSLLWVISFIPVLPTVTCKPTMSRFMSKSLSWASWALIPGPHQIETLYSQDKVILSIPNLFLLPDSLTWCIQSSYHHVTKTNQVASSLDSRSFPLGCWEWLVQLFAFTPKILDNFERLDFT